MFQILLKATLLVFISYQGTLAEETPPPLFAVQGSLSFNRGAGGGGLGLFPSFSNAGGSEGASNVGQGGIQQYQEDSGFMNPQRSSGYSASDGSRFDQTVQKIMQEKSSVNYENGRSGFGGSSDGSRVEYLQSGDQWNPQMKESGGGSFQEAQSTNQNVGLNSNTERQAWLVKEMEKSESGTGVSENIGRQTWLVNGNEKGDSGSESGTKIAQAQSTNQRVGLNSNAERQTWQVKEMEKSYSGSGLNANTGRQPWIANGNEKSDSGSGSGVKLVQDSGAVRSQDQRESFEKTGMMKGVSEDTKANVNAGQESKRKDSSSGKVEWKKIFAEALTFDADHAQLDESTKNAKSKDIDEPVILIVKEEIIPVENTESDAKAAEFLMTGSKKEETIKSDDGKAVEASSNQNPIRPIILIDDDFIRSQSDDVKELNKKTETKLAESENRKTISLKDYQKSLARTDNQETKDKKNDQTVLWVRKENQAANHEMALAEQQSSSSSRRGSLLLKDGGSSETNRGVPRGDSFGTFDSESKRLGGSYSQMTHANGEHTHQHHSSEHQNGRHQSGASSDGARQGVTWVRQPQGHQMGEGSLLEHHNSRLAEMKESESSMKKESGSSFNSQRSGSYADDKQRAILTDGSDFGAMSMGGSRGSSRMEGMNNQKQEEMNLKDDRETLRLLGFSRLDPSEREENKTSSQKKIGGLTVSGTFRFGGKAALNDDIPGEGGFPINHSPFIGNNFGISGFQGDAEGGRMQRASYDNGPSMMMNENMSPIREPNAFQTNGVYRSFGLSEPNFGAFGNVANYDPNNAFSGNMGNFAPVMENYMYANGVGNYPEYNEFRMRSDSFRGYGAETNPMLPDQQMYGFQRAQENYFPDSMNKVTFFRGNFGNSGMENLIRRKRKRRDLSLDEILFKDRHYHKVKDQEELQGLNEMPAESRKKRIRREQPSAPVGGQAAPKAPAAAAPSAPQAGAAKSAPSSAGAAVKSPVLQADAAAANGTNKSLLHRSPHASPAKKESKLNQGMYRKPSRGKSHAAKTAFRRPGHGKKALHRSPAAKKTKHASKKVFLKRTPHALKGKAEGGHKGHKAAAKGKSKLYRAPQAKGKSGKKLLHRARGAVQKAGLQHRNKGAAHSPGLKHRTKGAAQSPAVQHRSPQAKVQHRSPNARPQKIAKPGFRSPDADPKEKKMHFRSNVDASTVLPLAASIQPEVQAEPTVVPAAP